jgi:hypothetical protein
MTALNPPPLFEVSGAIHCHSTYSDGMEPIPVILAAANRAGLDYLLMTDHDTLAPLAEIGEQWSGRTLLLVGCEITPRHNHYLAYGITQEISPHLPPAEYTRAVAAQGGIGFIAHPFERGSTFLRQNRYTWEDWSVQEFTGIELWNYFSEWVGSCRNLWTTLRSLVSWRRAIRAPEPAALARWDEIGRRRRVVGIGGLDAHGIKFRALGREVVLHPYERAFRSVRTHLLLKEPFNGEVAHDRLLVLEALREGRCFIANHEEGDPRGFVFVARCEGRWLLMGEEALWPGPGAVWFSARVPYRHTGKPILRILKDGEVIAETADCDLQVADQGPGVYRVEAWRKGRGWIFSNPIYLRERREAEG